MVCNCEIMNESFHIADLIYRLFQDKLSVTEQEELQVWRKADPKNEALFQKLQDNQKALQKYEIYQQFDAKNAWQLMESRLGETKVVPMYRKAWRYAAAILLPVMIASAILYIWMTPTDPLAGVDEVIKPGQEQAVLTLADGKEMTLEKNDAPKEIDQGPARLKNAENALAYEPTATKEKQETVFNKLTTPTGGTYRVVLADGTKVTLNAASSLRYPVAFTDSTRSVFLTGEAYFDVTHTGAPFMVKSASQEVRVLGTEFNIKAYGDEASVETTLIEGSVQVETTFGPKLLQPGDQAILTRSALDISPVSPAKYTAWMSGKFQFSGASMEEVMLTLARWYGFEYSFANEEAKDLHFTGRVDNQQPISAILKMLEATTLVKFKFQDDQISIH